MKLTEIGRLGHWVNLSKLKKNSVIVDAGACTGGFIEEMRKHIDCKIVAIEPSPENFKILKEKKFNNIQLYHNALVGNDKDSFAIFYSYPQKEIGNLLCLYPGSDNRISIRTIKLNILGLKKIDYFKIDIEGAEKDLFEQMTQREADTIQQLCVEVHSNGDINKLKLRLEELGFECQIMSRSEIYASRQ